MAVNNEIGVRQPVEEIGKYNYKQNYQYCDWINSSGKHSEVKVQHQRLERRKEWKVLEKYFFIYVVLYYSICTFLQGLCAKQRKCSSTLMQHRYGTCKKSFSRLHHSLC